MLVHDIRKNQSQVIDFREVAPLGVPLDGDLPKDTKVRSPPAGPGRLGALLLASQCERGPGK